MSGSALEPEHRSIEFVPLNERHGRPRSLFTLWFGGNLQVTTIAAGAISVAIGVPLLWAIVASIIGQLIGAIFMALHSAQGPRLGVPQMIQSRAQFGFYGAIVPLVLVILMYVGYFATTGVQGGAALSSLTGAPADVSIFVVAVVTIFLTIFGYRLIHVAQRWLSLLSGLAFLYLTWMLVMNHNSAALWTTRGFTWPPFLLSVAIAATWQLTYGPYVADYSRYLPVESSRKAAFWWTYAGSVISSTWMFAFGAYATAVAPKAFDGGSVDFIVDQSRILRPVFLIIIIGGVVGVNALNLYGAFMSTTTVLSAARKMRISRRTRALIITVIALFSITVAIVGKGDFLGNFSNFILFLAYFLIPWSSINLTDFYLVRKEKYNVDELFKPRGEYGGVDWRAMTAYIFGALIEVPFISSTLFTGPVAAAMGGADISWILGIFGAGGAYLFLMKKFPARSRYAPAESQTTVVHRTDEYSA